MKYIISAQTEETLGKDGLVLPTIKGTLSSVQSPLLQDVGQLVSNAPYFQLYYDQYLPPAVGQVIIDSVQGLYAGTLTPDATAKAIEESAASELQQ